MASISVIIPTCDRPDMVREALATVRRQTRRPEEVILVDNGTTAVPEELVAEVIGWRVAPIPPRSGASFARNWGAWQATGELLAFLDDDDLWPEDYLERMHACIERTESGLVAAPQRLAETLEETERPVPPDARGRFPRWSRLGYRGSNLLVRRRAFWSVNGFPTQMVTGEDRAFAIALAESGERVSVCTDTYGLKREHAGPQLTDRATLAVGKLCFLNEFGPRMPRKDLKEDRLAVVMSLSKTWGWPLWLVGVPMAPAAAFRRARKFLPGARARRRTGRSV